MIATARREVRVDVRWVVAGAWLLAAAAELTGRGSLFNHDTLIHGGLPRPAALALFLVAWQFMVAAMMLPSALPLIRLFDRASASRPIATNSLLVLPEAALQIFGVADVVRVVGAAKHVNPELHLRCASALRLRASPSAQDERKLGGLQPIQYRLINPASRPWICTWSGL